MVPRQPPTRNTQHAPPHTHTTHVNALRFVLTLRRSCARTRFIAESGFALASVRPPTLFRMIKEQVEQGPSADKIEVSDQLLLDTLLGTATYSVQRR